MPTNIANLKPVPDPAQRATVGGVLGGKDTVATNMGTLLDENSDYIKRARHHGMQAAAGRGLLNSSLAAGNAQAAAIDAALPIASQDSSQGTAWRQQQMGHEMTKDISKQEYGQQRGLAEQGYGHQRGLAQQGYGHQKGLAQQGYGHQKGLAKQGYGQQKGLAQQAYKHSGSLVKQEYKQRSAMEEKLQNMRAEGAIDLQTLKQAGTEMQLNERMTQSYVQLNAGLQQTKMQEIEEVQQAEGLTSAQKTAAIQEIQTRFSSEYAWLDTLFGNIKEWNWDGV